jgi:WD40 repeat protein/serine/threonine protein kinase
MTTSNEPGGAEDRVELIYDEFRRRALNGEAVQIADLCAQHPQFAAKLRFLHGRQPTSDPDATTDGDPPHAEGAGAPVVAMHDVAKRYGVRGQLAQGGMGVIFRVWDESLRRELAMKIIRGQEKLGPNASVHAVAPRRLARFIREAEITARLDHPGVVPIHEYGTDEQGRAYFTMRLIQGKSLDTVFEMVRKGYDRWTHTRALDVIVKVCETVAFAHSRAVIHRDLKPENIMVGPFGETYVMDWGLAKVVDRRPAGSPAADIDMEPDEECDVGQQGETCDQTNEAAVAGDATAETRYGSVLGTPSYMAPEQAAGRTDELDERSDIYSVGAILYELLAGQRPYAVPGTALSAREIVLAEVAGPPTPLTRLNARLPAELVAICEKAMARRKEGRYQSMQQMAEDLRAYLERRVVRAYQTGAVAELKKWIMRNRGLAIAAALVVLVSIGGLLSVVKVQSDAYESLTKANSEIARESSLKEEALTQETAARKAADAERRRAEGLLLVRQSAGVLATNPAQALLLAIQSDARNPSFDANCALLAALENHHEARTLVGHRGPLRMAASSADGAHVVTASDDHTAIVWDSATGQPLTWLIGHRDWIRHVRFSPDGKRVATASADGTAAIWDPRTGERLHVLAGHEQVVSQVAFSPDGGSLATASWDGTIGIWDVGTGERRRVLRGHHAIIYCVAFNHDGSRLVSGSADTTARIWESSTGAPLATFEGHEGGVGVAKFNADGRYVVTTAAQSWESPMSRGTSLPSTDQTARIWDAHSGEVRHELKHGAVVECAAFGPLNVNLVTGSADGTVRLFDGVSGELVKALNGLDGAVHSIAISSDDRTIAAGTARGSMWLVDHATARRPQRCTGHSDAVVSADFISPDRVLTASRDGTARVWKVRAPGVVECPHALPNELVHTSLAISANAKRVAVRPLPSRQVSLCEMPTGDAIAVLEHDATVYEVRFSPDDELVATLSERGDVRTWSASDGRLRASLDGTGKANQVEFSSDGRLLVVSPSDGLVTTWNAATGEKIHRFELTGMEIAPLGRHGRFVVAWSQASRDAEVWDTATGLHVGKLPDLTRSPQDYPYCAASPDGGALVTSSVERPQATIWRTSPIRRVADIEHAVDKHWLVAFSDDGATFATGSEESVARLWDASTGESRGALTGFEHSAESIVVGPLARRVLTRSPDLRSRLWDGRSGASLGLLGEGDQSLDRAVFSGDGRWLVTLNRKLDSIVLWDALNAGRQALVAGGYEPFSDLAMSRDGRWFVTARKSGAAQIWPTEPSEFARSQAPRDLTPNELDLFQIGTGEERAGDRRISERHSLVRLLAALSKVPARSDQRRDLREAAEAAVGEFIESVGAETNSQRIESLVDVERALGDQIEPGAAVATALAERHRASADFAGAQRLLRTVLDQGEGDLSAWTCWAACSLGGLNRSVQQLLSDFPQARDAVADDLKWLLDRMARDETIRIHSGGDDFVGADGTFWRHDCFFGGGHLFGESLGDTRPSTVEIQGTDDDALYQTERWFDPQAPKPRRGYQIPLPPGRYRVTLHFAEVYWRPPAGRVFDVVIEDETRLSRYDLRAPGFAIADVKKFEVRVDDGLLEIEFRAIEDNPKISAIEIAHLGE